MVIAANPSGLVSLARTGDERNEELIRDFHRGTISLNIDIPDDIRAALSCRHRPEPKLARKFEAVADRFAIRAIIGVRLHFALARGPAPASAVPGADRDLNGQRRSPAIGADKPRVRIKRTNHLSGDRGRLAPLWIGRPAQGTTELTKLLWLGRSRPTKLSR
jgi:hypothetical protein